ncbi:hypothetical protein A6S26_16530 [Nostoc sp. ATCC 43529]|nr:hypothetical protein A6S26_16530 [Nostoc sp. ATCC 43529]
MDLFPSDWVLGIGYRALVLSKVVGAASRREVLGMGHWRWELPIFAYLHLLREWKKRCEQTSQRFFQEGSYEYALYSSSSRVQDIN